MAKKTKTWLWIAGEVAVASIGYLFVSKKEEAAKKKLEEEEEVPPGPGPGGVAPGGGIGPSPGGRQPPPQSLIPDMPYPDAVVTAAGTASNFLNETLVWYVFQRPRIAPAPGLPTSSWQAGIVWPEPEGNVVYDEIFNSNSEAVEFVQDALASVGYTEFEWFPQYVAPAGLSESP